MVLKCQECGWENNPENKFCETCGSPLQPSSQDKNKNQDKNIASLVSEPTIVSGTYQKETKSKFIQCPQCQALNPTNAPYCSTCGTSLKTSTPSFTSNLEEPKPDENHSSELSTTSMNSSKDGKKKVIIGAALLCGVLLIGGGVWWWMNSSNSNSNTAQSETSNTSRIAIISHENSNTASHNYSSEISTSIVIPEESKIELISNAMMLDVKLEDSMASNYSGASCAVMALNLQGIDVSQSSIGRELGLDQGKITSYDDLTRLLNSKISKSGSNNLYSNYYMETDYMSSEDLNNTYTVFLKHMDQALQEGRAPLVIIGESPDGKLQRNFYGLIVGKPSDDTYSIVIPYVDGAQTYEVDLQTLANMITAPEVFCYLY